MYRRLAWLAVGLLASCLLAPSAMAQLQPIAFEGAGTLSVKPDGAATATLANNTAVSYRLKFTVVDEAGKETLAVEIDAPPQAIAPGGVVAVVLKATKGAAPTKGFLVAVATGAGIPEATARRPFAVAAATAVLEPRVAKWSVTSYRGAGLYNNVLPVKGASECPKVAEPVEVGGVSTPAGGGARVSATCTASGVYAGALGVRLTFDGVRHQTGDYTGTIDLLPDDEKKGTVELTVRRTDVIWFPLLALLAGTGVAVAVGAWVGRGNTISEDIEDAWRLLVAADRAERAFAEKSATKTWRYYSFQPALRETVLATIDGLRTLGRRWSKLATDDPERKRLVSQLDDPLKLVMLWPALADVLAELWSSEAAVRAAAEQYAPPRDPRYPKFLEWAHALLLGRSGLTVADGLKLATQIDDARTLADWWPDWVAKIVELSTASNLIEAAMNVEPSHPDRVTLIDIRGLLSRVTEELWSAENSDELVAWRSVDTLDLARAKVDSLRHYVTNQEAADAGQAFGKVGELLTRFVRPSWVRRVLSTFARPAEEAKEEASKRTSRNLVVLLILMAVTVWAGLVANYFDKPFGTPRHYMTIFVWGFGVQAILEGLAAGADRLRTRPPKPGL
jgi:hypothetical protein